jgi:hypothetical protein
MIPIHFQANYNPALKQFQVEVAVGAGDGSFKHVSRLNKPPITQPVFVAGQRWVELMLPEKFLEFADNTGPMVISGVTLSFIDGFDPVAEKQIRDYFKKVATSYRAWLKEQE